MALLVVNGPNLSQLGTRDPQIYGTASLEELVAAAREIAPDLEVFTSEHEGALVTRLHHARGDGTEAVVINPGALTHYSYALRDALDILDVPKVEVHLSQTHAREEFRHRSVVSPVVDATLTGLGRHAYRVGVEVALALIAERR